MYKENETETETEHGSKFRTRPRRDRESRILQSRDRDSRQSVVDGCRKKDYKNGLAYFEVGQTKVGC